MVQEPDVITLADLAEKLDKLSAEVARLSGLLDSLFSYIHEAGEILEGATCHPNEDDVIISTLGEPTRKQCSNCGTVYEKARGG